jgi:hypothetical protein
MNAWGELLSSLMGLGLVYIKRFPALKGWAIFKWELVRNSTSVLQ